jgi:thioredoxin reductase (NADPH)
MDMDFSLSLVSHPEQPEVASDDADSASSVRDLIVIGGGPAGLTAALYAARNGIEPLVFTGHMPGGQIANTERMENYPGFPDGISGPDLAERLVEHTSRFVSGILQEGVRAVDFSVRPFEISAASGKYSARAVIIATGSFPRRLGVKGESEYFGRGVSTCATCDGFFYRDRRVVVVGGGDSAIEEGLFLTKFASEVIVIHRRDELRASDILQDRAFTNPAMRFVWDSVVEEIVGEQTVKAVRIRNVKTSEESQIETDGVFVYVGLLPATKIFQGQLELDANGYVITDRRLRASVPGVFAAGDVQSPSFRQAVIAAGSGAQAAMEADRYLAKTTGDA